MGILQGFPPSKVITNPIKIGPNDLVNWTDAELYVDEFGKIRQLKKKKKKKNTRQITEPFLVSMDQ